jgi:hypothetical protein
MPLNFGSCDQSPVRFPLGNWEMKEMGGHSRFPFLGLVVDAMSGETTKAPPLIVHCKMERKAGDENGEFEQICGKPQWDGKVASALPPFSDFDPILDQYGLSRCEFR